MKKIYSELYKMLTKRQKFNFIFITVLMAVSAAISQFIPLCIGDLTDSLFTGTSPFSFYSILPFLAFILVISILNEVLKVVRRLSVEDTCTRFEKAARCSAIETLLKAPLSYFQEHMTGNIHGKLNRSLEGTTRLLKLLFMDFAPAVFTGIASIVVIFYKLPVFLAALSILVVPIGVLIVYRQISTQKGIRIHLLEEKSNMDGVMVELLGGIEVIRVYNTTDMETKRFFDKSESLRQEEMRHHAAMAKYDCLKFINEAVFTVTIIGGAVYLAGRHAISVGMILTAYLSFTQLTAPLRELHRILDELSESTLLAEEYFKIKNLPLDFSYAPVPQETALLPNQREFDIRMDHTHFSYGSQDKEILKDIDLQIPYGTYVGMAGSSGCGKSTLIRLLCKLEQTSSVYLNHSPVNTLSRRQISEIITLIPQNPFLVAGTIRENICYGLDRNASGEELKEASRRAQIDSFIESLPLKYDTLIAEGGKNLSGGQKQRIALARVFLRKPRILILDEATSALDNVSEKNIQLELEKLHRETGMTIIAIAHRLTTLRNCDVIFVMDQGRIVQQGTYKELTSQEGLFRDFLQTTEHTPF